MQQLYDISTNIYYEQVHARAAIQLSSNSSWSEFPVDTPHCTVAQQSWMISWLALPFLGACSSKLTFNLQTIATKPARDLNTGRGRLSVAQYSGKRINVLCCARKARDAPQQADPSPAIIRLALFWQAGTERNSKCCLCCQRQAHVLHAATPGQHTSHSAHKHTSWQHPCISHITKKRKQHPSATIKGASRSNQKQPNANQPYASRVPSICDCTRHLDKHSRLWFRSTHKACVSSDTRQFHGIHSRVVTPFTLWPYASPWPGSWTLTSFACLLVFEHKLIHDRCSELMRSPILSKLVCQHQQTRTLVRV